MHDNFFCFEAEKASVVLVSTTYEQTLHMINCLMLILGTVQCSSLSNSIQDPKVLWHVKATLSRDGEGFAWRNQEFKVQVM